MGEYFYQSEGRDINIVLRSTERLRTLAKGTDKDAYQAEVFYKSQILWERDTEVSDLIKKISKSI